MQGFEEPGLGAGSCIRLSLKEGTEQWQKRWSREITEKKSTADAQKDSKV